MKLLVILASTRPGRAGPAVASWFLDQVGTEHGFEVEIADLAEVDLPLLDEPHHAAEGRYTRDHTRAWSARVAAADAFVLVMPEYNVGFTAPLKNALDYLHHEWTHKPVGFVSYGMTSGGMRAVEMIKPVVVSLKMVPVHDSVTVHLRQRLDDSGVLHPDAVMEQAASELLAQIGRMAEATMALRARKGVPDAALAEVSR